MDKKIKDIDFIRLFVDKTHKFIKILIISQFQKKENHIMSKPYHVLDICRYTINYSNKKQYGISNLKLQKLLYFIQAYFVALTDSHTPCFEERIEAWDFGPVVPVAYNEYKAYGSADIPYIDSYIDFDYNNMWNSRRISFDETCIAEEDRGLIAAVIDQFSDYSSTDLVNLTHRQAPWSKVYIPKRKREITIDSIRKYFDEEYGE